MKGQSLTFAGMNAHHQNTMAERYIGMLQEHARTKLIHAKRRWPKCVTANLWPYVLRMANDVLNETPNMLDKQKRTPQQIFANTKALPNPKHGNHLDALPMSWIVDCRDLAEYSTNGNSDQKLASTWVDPHSMPQVWPWY
jgi:hypothetical protein